MSPSATNPPLALRLLGEFSLQLGDRPLTGLPSRKAEALLIYLACTRRPVAREVLADLLWDDRPPELALSNLRTILSGLRKAVGGALIVGRNNIAFNRESPYQIDAEAFERELAQSQMPGADAETTLCHLRSAVGLYNGDFLAGFHLRESRGFEAWATLERERLNRLAVNALRRLVQHSLDTGDYAAGLEFADQRLRLDPLSEEAHRHLMLLCARTGQRARALAAYAACRRVLAEELGVEPTDATTSLYAFIRSADSLGTHTLPPSGTEFIGRETEIETLVAELARPDCRLVTLLGPGGIGKTRLAVEAARQIAARRPGMFLHGIRFAALIGLHEAQYLATALAEALGIALAGDPRAQLLDFLREREVLLVLDNLEHLLGEPGIAADLLAEVLAAAPMVKLLVTSRERLNLQEERLFDVEGLAVPAIGALGPWEQHSAARLFVTSARRVRREFSPSADEAHAIVSVCSQLDGAPLGIELAAAAVRQQTCVQIAAALANSLDALATTARNVPERHRSLRAAFEHSWDLLAAEGRARFVRLSVFPDGFDAPGAAAIAEVSLAALSDLGDRSLIQAQGDGRFRIHPMLRQYAAEKLADWPDTAASLEERHARYYLDLLARQGTGEKPDQRGIIRLELPNLRAAWRWAAGRQDLAALRPAIAPLHGFYATQSWFQEGIETFAFAAAQFTEPPGARSDQAPAQCEVLMRLARMQIHIGQLEAARVVLQRAQQHLPYVDDRDQQSTVLVYLAITHYYAEDYGLAKDLAEASLRLAEQTGSREGIASALNFMGSCAKATGDYARAQSLFESAVLAYRALDDGIGAAMVLNNLGNLAQACGDYAAARRRYHECSELFKALDHVHGAATTLANAGRLAVRQGELDEARRLLEESLELKRRISDRRGMAVALLALGDVATRSGAFAEARRQLTETLALAEETGDQKLALDTLVAVAALLSGLGRTETAARAVAYVLAHRAASQESREAAEQLAADLGGLRPEAEAAARRWARGETPAEVAARVLPEAMAPG